MHKNQERREKLASYNRKYLAKRKQDALDWFIAEVTK